MGAPAFQIEQQARPLPAQLQEAIGAHFGAARCTDKRGIRDQHGKDDSLYPCLPPALVVYPENTDEVAWLLARCNAARVPVVPYGAGSSFEGHVLAVEGGVSVNLSRMNRVLAVHAEDFAATVQAGVTREQLNRELQHTGLFFPVDPGADATLGGMAATRASGTTTVRYGSMRENVISLEAVLADGSVIRTGGWPRKSSAGYDLTHLLVGSEGTLGIITAVTLRLQPRPQAVLAATCSFPTLAAAVDCVIEVMQMAIPMARIELMDVSTVRAVNAYSQLELPQAPLLLLEFHGTTQEEVQAQAALVGDMAAAHGGSGFIRAERPEERSRLWQARHQSTVADVQLRPGATMVSTDVCVPISRLAESVERAAQDLAAASFPYTIVGHVGDGNFHANMLVDPEQPAEWAEAEAINARIVERAIEMGGTCTGEHGIGLHKRAWLTREFGADTVAAMRRIKLALDPHDIMNPGKVLP